LQEAIKHPKSPLILLSTIGTLIIVTLVFASSTFLRPKIESDLKKQLHSQLSLSGLDETLIHISGRDVILMGTVKDKSEAEKAENTAKKIWGVRNVSNEILIEN